MAPREPAGLARAPATERRQPTARRREQRAAHRHPLLDEALRHRPDYAAQRERVRQAESTVAALRGDYPPQLSLGSTGSCRAASADSRSVPSEEPAAWTCRRRVSRALA